MSAGRVVRFPIERRAVSTVSTVGEANLRAVLGHVYVECFRRVMRGEDWPEAHAAEARTILRVFDQAIERERPKG